MSQVSEVTLTVKRSLDVLGKLLTDYSIWISPVISDLSVPTSQLCQITLVFCTLY